MVRRGHRCGRQTARQAEARESQRATRARSAGEAIALRLGDVEFLTRRLVVSENAVQLGADHAVGLTKGRKVRSVPVPSFVLDEISPLCANKAPGDLVQRSLSTPTQTSLTTT